MAIPFLGCVYLESLVGCRDSSKAYTDARIKTIYGRRGFSEGRFTQPRAMTIDRNDHIYVVDKTGRIQVFDSEGTFLHFWNTPAIDNGKPTGISVDRDGNILVADTHYYRVLFYTPMGERLEEKTIGGTNGQGPGEFGFVTDIVQDSLGNYFVSEYGEFDRIQKFAPNGEFICQFGKHGDGPIEFNRPQSMVIDAQDQIWIADSCNHRIQVIRCPNDTPELIKTFGEYGSLPGQYKTPYGITMNHEGNLLITEFTNHRVQCIDKDGKPLASWGSPGRAEGQLHSPWCCVEDSKHRIHILDTQNNRIQCISHI